ncbi:hypothetical protein B0T21DRAFT_191016 [Apiosordaria backusii]|uniref:Secreted protein n=1 Tax=Apiosordaria backusii TaxID=314023 RepID=A0AA40EFM7_9PEZI|nr:hypothetical protein B0T21DRAFT_191016 [Apiosordaria backusii]
MRGQGMLPLAFPVLPALTMQVKLGSGHEVEPITLAQPGGMKLLAAFFHDESSEQRHRPRTCGPVRCITITPSLWGLRWTLTAPAFLERHIRQTVIRCRCRARHFSPELRLASAPERGFPASPSPPMRHS